jgi:hypothetical protein
MYEYAVDRIGCRWAGVSSRALSTTPRRKVRESSLRSAGAEGEVKDAGERRDRDTRERDEGEDAAARRMLNDSPHPLADRGACRQERRGGERAAQTEGPIPDDRGRDPEAKAGECAPAPAYRCRSAKRDDERRHDQRDELRRPSEENAEDEDEKGP